MKILAFAGSSSRQSINKQLAVYAASLFGSDDVEVLDLNDFELPLFSVDREKELGQPILAQKFLDKLHGADVIVLSLAEHNGAFSVAFKNIYDWASRIDKNVFGNKPMLLMSTSPGRGGEKTVLEVAKLSMPRYGANIMEVFSLPQFGENFDAGSGTVSNQEYDNALRQAVERMQ